MDDPAVVQGREAARDLTQERGRPHPVAELRALALERAAADQRHHQEQSAVEESDVDDSNQVRMSELGGNLRFACEPCHQIAIAVAAQRLERELASVSEALAAEHGAHASS